MMLLFSAVGETALSLAYGIEIKPIDDPFIELAESAMETLAKAASVGALLIDLIPIIKYIPEFVPGGGFKKQARIGRQLVENFRERPYLAAIKAMVCTPHLQLKISKSSLGLWPRPTLIHINGSGGC